MSKRAGNVTMIGGADGPTSIFIAQKGGKVKLRTRMANYFRKRKRDRIKGRITANPHTLDEVVEMMKREYGALELSQRSVHYQEQRSSLKASLVMRHRPDLLGELMDLKPPKGAYSENMEAWKTFWDKLKEREKRANEIADDVFPIDFHMYEIRCAENGRLQVGVEMVWQTLDGSFSGNKKSMKQLRKMMKRIYLYYGVTAEDIKNETERYTSLLAMLSL